MAIAETRAQLKATLDEINTLRANPEITQEDVERIKTLLQKGKNLKAQLDLLGAATEFTAEMSQSAGMLNLAGTGAPATPLGMQESGSITVKGKAGNVLIDDDGEPVVDRKMWTTISDPEYRRAFRAYLRGGTVGLKDAQIKVLQEGVDTAGGFLVPDDILNRLIAREPAPQSVASRVTTVNTSRDALAVPQIIYSSDTYTTAMRVTWTGETPASATAHRVTEPVFGQVRIPVYTAMMSLPLTNDMIEDSSFPIVNWVTSKFAETIDLLKENMVLNGTGAAQPEGILACPAIASTRVATGSASALTWGGIQSLAFALPEQYDQNAVFVMNKTNTALALAKLLDNDNRPYWSAGSIDYGLQNGPIQKPLLGYPVVFSAFMPDVAAGAYPILFGDLRGYWIVDRIGFSIQVLRELYAETNQILLLGRVRFGGACVENWKLRAQYVSA